MCPQTAVQSQLVTFSSDSYFVSSLTQTSITLLNLSYVFLQAEEIAEISYREGSELEEWPP